MLLVCHLKLWAHIMMARIRQEHFHSHRQMVIITTQLQLTIQVVANHTTTCSLMWRYTDGSVLLSQCGAIYRQQDKVASYCEHFHRQYF
nr:MAG TPA: hypothetical protein [Caudoviricetes sp.]